MPIVITAIRITDIDYPHAISKLISEWNLYDPISVKSQFTKLLTIITEKVTI